MRVVMVLFLVCLTWGCGASEDYGMHLDERTFNARHLQMVADSIGVELPSGTRGLHLFCGGRVLDASFIAKLEIPSDAAKKFVVQIEGIKHLDALVLFNVPSVTWWRPEDGVVHIERVFERGMSGVQLYVCEENGLWILYVKQVKP